MELPQANRIFKFLTYKTAFLEGKIRLRNVKDKTFEGQENAFLS